MPTLHWIGKEKVQTHHNDVPYRVLEKQYTYGNENNTCGDDACGDDASRVVKNIRAAGDAGASPANNAGQTVCFKPTADEGVRVPGENMIIHGDNLEALKALLPEYQGRVDCIYIDPPYNTGNEGWVYNDNVNDPHIRKWLGAVVGKEAEDLTRHDKWLCMMYPRLVLLQKLLSPTGAIFISIDDNEQANLKLICDEIFGKSNHLCTIVWQKIHSTKNDAKYFSENHEYALVYTKNKPNFTLHLLPRTKEMNGRYTNRDNDIRGPWQSGDLVAAGERSNGHYIVISPKTGKEFDVPLGKHWVYSEENMRALIATNQIWFGDTGNSFPRKKRFLCSVQSGRTPNTLWLSDEVGHNQTATKEIISIFGDKNIFDFPKPVEYISQILQIATHKDALILDSFAGSGTTAHAVLNLNKQDGGHRRFILVEMCDYAETITAERVRRVIDGYGEGSKAVEGTGGSFAFYELGDTVYDPQTGLLNDHTDTEQIRRYIWFSETNTPYHSPKDCGDDASRVVKDTGAAGDADALVRGRFGTNRMTMQCCEDDAGRVVSTLSTLPTPSTPHPYLLGRKDGTNYYFYYKRDKETVLDRAFLNTFTPADQAEQYIIYADCCRLSRDFMLTHHITFKQIPRDIKKV